MFEEQCHVATQNERLYSINSAKKYEIYETPEKMLHLKKM